VVTSLSPYRAHGLLRAVRDMSQATGRIWKSIYIRTGCLFISYSADLDMPQTRINIGGNVTSNLTFRLLFV
jgi:hypothetical protein